MIDYLIKNKNNLFINKLLKLLGLEIHKNAYISPKAKFIHMPYGTVITDKVIIEDDVQIYNGVTLGKADIFLETKEINKKAGNIILKKGCIIGAGAKILLKDGDLIVEENSVIGANAVLTKSTGKNEIWAGIPAKKIRVRDDI